MKKAAFTLIELILVLTLFMLILGYGMPKALEAFFQNDLESASQEIVHVLRRANSNALFQIHDNPWGVYFNSAANEYTFFSGSSYASRNTNYDLLYELPESLSFSSISLSGGGEEVIFDQITGNTNQEGSIELTGANGNTHTITIYSLGNVSKE